MLRLLLDFPWAVESVLDAYSDAFEALNRFERVRASENLGVVPFISQNDYLRLWADPRLAQPGSNVLAPLLNVIDTYVQWHPGQVRAAPRSGPSDTSISWQYGLGDELALENWRTPQLMVTDSRILDWRRSVTGRPAQTEAALRREGFENDEHRVIASTDAYYDHEFATSDRNPWDLRRRWPVNPEAPPHQRHPCELPRPRTLRDVRFEQLRAAVAHIDRWGIDERWFYIPAKDWDPSTISQISWRNGRTFPHVPCPHCHRASPVDRLGQVWCWDDNERHWDVQLRPEYWKISHDGRLRGTALNTRH